MAQIRQVVSESLQATIRRLLPSQQGFTEDLQASNVITPIIDLTPSAEGSSLPENLQNSLSFDGLTSFNITNTTTTIVNNAGFHRIFGLMQVLVNTAALTTNVLQLNDGSSTKTLISQTNPDFGVQDQLITTFDFVVYLNAGESLEGVSNSADNIIVGTTRQLADISGNLVNPAGFTGS